MRFSRDMLTVEEQRALSLVADGAQLAATAPEALRLVGLGLIAPDGRRLRLTPLGLALATERTAPHVPRRPTA